MRNLFAFLALVSTGCGLGYATSKVSQPTTMPNGDVSIVSHSRSMVGFVSEQELANPGTEAQQLAMARMYGYYPYGMGVYGANLYGQYPYLMDGRVYTDRVAAYELDSVLDRPAERITVIRGRTSGTTSDGGGSSWGGSGGGGSSRRVAPSPPPVVRSDGEEVCSLQTTALRDAFRKSGDALREAARNLPRTLEEVTKQVDALRKILRKAEDACVRNASALTEIRGYSDRLDPIDRQIEDTLTRDAT